MGFKQAKIFSKDHLSIHTGTYGGVPLLVTVGECDAHSVDALSDAVSYAVDTKVKSLIVDLRATDHLDGSCRQTLVHARETLGKLGGKLVIVSPDKPTYYVLRPLGLAALIPVVSTLRQAINCLTVAH